MNKAYFVKRVTSSVERVQEVYRLNPPLEGYSTVLVSGVISPWGTETYIFPSDEDGNVLDWGELPGSFQGERDIERALENAGYEVVNQLTIEGSVEDD